MKINVRVIYTPPLREVLSKREETVALDRPEATLMDLIEYLSKKYGEKFHRHLLDPQARKLRDGIVLFVNGKHSDPQTPLSENSEVAFVMAIGGG